MTVRLGLGIMGWRGFEYTQCVCAEYTQAIFIGWSIRDAGPCGFRLTHRSKDMEITIRYLRGACRLRWVKKLIGFRGITIAQNSDEV